MSAGRKTRCLRHLGPRGLDTCSTSCFNTLFVSTSFSWGLLIKERASVTCSRGCSEVVSQSDAEVAKLEESKNALGPGPLHSSPFQFSCEASKLFPECFRFCVCPIQIQEKTTESMNPTNPRLPRLQHKEKPLPNELFGRHDGKFTWPKSNPRGTTCSECSPPNKQDLFTVPALASGFR